MYFPSSWLNPQILIANYIIKLGVGSFRRCVSLLQLLKTKWRKEPTVFGIPARPWFLPVDAGYEFVFHFLIILC